MDDFMSDPKDDEQNYWLKCLDTSSLNQLIKTK